MANPTETPSSLELAALRNIDRFPADFMFQLTKDEATTLRSQFGSYAPYAFTEGETQALPAN
jgi:hypothetical protein